MIKIFFISYWGDTPSQLLEQYKKLTINNSGKWNNLIGTTDITQTDYIIIMEGIPEKYINIIHNFNKNNIICFPREPNIVNISKNYLNLNIPNAYTYSNMYHIISNFNFLGETYDTLYNLKYPHKNKLLSCIISGKKSSTRILRYNFVFNFSNHNPSIIDVYGKSLNWNNKPFYKGNVSYKNTSLLAYKYSLCFENSSQFNYFSEKFTDAIMCWTIPIYWGCPNIHEFFPKHSYYYVDITSKNAENDILTIINKPITEKNIQALQEARNLILNKYNIWSTIENIIYNI